jgi:hypothetical protein
MSVQMKTAKPQRFYIHINQNGNVEWYIGNFEEPTKKNMNIDNMYYWFGD